MFLLRPGLVTGKKNGRALFALGLVSFFWGTTWIASREGVQHMPALQLAGIRQTIGGACYVLFFMIKGAAWPKGRQWRIVLVLAFLNFTLSNGLSTWGVQYISAGLGAIIGAIFPLWLVLIGFIVEKTAPSPKALLGLAVGFAGICVVFYEHLEDLLKPQFLFGIAVSVAATWSWALGTLYTKKHAAGFDPYFSLGLQMLLSGVFVYALTLVTGVAVPVAVIPWQSWVAIAYLVLAGSVVAFMAYLYALQRLPTEQVALYAYINPIVAVLFGAWLFGEILTPFIVVGTLITLYGVWLVNKSVGKIAQRK